MERIWLIDRPRRASFFYGGRPGGKSAVRIDGRAWMVKYPRKGSSPLSEYVGSRVYEFLGIPVQEVRLGILEGTLVAACRDFTEDLDVSSGIVRVYSMGDLVNDDLGPMEDVRLRASSVGRGRETDLGELLFTLEHHPAVPRSFLTRFWEIFVVDALLGNGARPNDNWGFVVSADGSHRLLPVFGNSRCLFAAREEAWIEKVLTCPDLYAEALYDDGEAFSYRNRKVDPLAAVENLGIPCEGKNRDLMMAVLRLVPAIRGCMSRILEFLDQIPETRYGVSVISPARRRLYKRLLAERAEKILEPAYEKSAALL